MTIWADLTILAIKVAIIRTNPAYIKPQESLGGIDSIAPEFW
jgi:hypothetical protein